MITLFPRKYTIKKGKDVCKRCLIKYPLVKADCNMLLGRDDSQPASINN